MDEPRVKMLQTICIPVVVFCLLSTATATHAKEPTSSKHSPKRSDSRKIFDHLEILSQVIHFVDTNYLNELKSKDLIDSAIRGIAASLDKYSRYYSAEEFEEQMRVDTEKFSLGINWKILKGRYKVIGTRSDSVAARAGITAGDEILRVNRLDPRVLEKVSLKKLLMGREGKWISLQLRDASGKERLVRVPPPEAEQIFARQTKERIVVIRIGKFFMNASQVVQQTLSKYSAEPRGYIIDIRGNTGGVVEEAVRIADLWLREGVIASMKDRAGKTTVYRAKPGNTLPEVPVIVMVDGQTASAAEVLAAGLIKNNRAKAVGTQTFGKGTVQTLMRLADGSALRLTVARLFGPKGQSLEGLGIAPDIQVLPGRLADGRDRQYARGLDALLYPR